MNEINFEIKDVETINLTMDVGIKEIYPPIENLEVTPTKEKQIFTHEGSYGYDEVTVNAMPETKLQTKEVTPTKELQVVGVDEEYDGLDAVVINPIPDEYIIPDGTLDVDANGDVDVTMFRMARVGVYTPPNLQDKEVTPTKEIQTVTPDEGYDGLNNVTVNPIPENYVEVVDKNIGQEFYDAYSKLHEKISSSYNKKYDTNEEVILYSPASDYTKYFIIQSTTNKFTIHWHKPRVPIVYSENVIRWYQTLKVAFSTNILTEEKKNNIDGAVMIYRNSGIENYAGTYTSPSYDTVEEAIDALKDSSTIYSLTTGANVYQTKYVKKYGNTETPVVITNYIEIGHTGLINECARQISSNETIEVITT